MPKHCAELFSSLSSNLDFVLVAVIVGKVERGEAFVAYQAPEKLNSALDLDIVTTETEMDNSLVIALKNSCKLLDSNICDKISVQL